MKKKNCVFLSAVNSEQKKLNKKLLYLLIKKIKVNVPFHDL